MSDVRVGLGVDAHAFAEGVPLVLGGVRIDSPRGLAGHSDGDVLAHALTDAVLGAAGMEDIGALFPDAQGADSVGLLREAWGAVRAEMHERLAEALGVAPGLVTVRATTTDRLGFTGRGEGLAAIAVALVEE